MQLLLVVGVLLLSLLMIHLGFVGLQDVLGFWWALGALALLFALRVSLPLTIGAYFGVVNVYGWPWYIGVLVAAPGLLFIVPAMVTGVFESIFRRR